MSIIYTEKYTELSTHLTRSLQHKNILIDDCIKMVLDYLWCPGDENKVMITKFEQTTVTWFSWPHTYTFGLITDIDGNCFNFRCTGRLVFVSKGYTIINLDDSSEELISNLHNQLNTYITTRPSWFADQSIFEVDPSLYQIVGEYLLHTKPVEFILNLQSVYTFDKNKTYRIIIKAINMPITTLR